MTMNIIEPELLHLSSGVRLVHIQRRGAGAGIFGIAVRAGSADENCDEFGLAHLVEHTIFKGTVRRSSWHIINRMEAVGGELNAYTTKEETVVYSIFPSGNDSRAIELIADLTLNSRFPERELEKEREVVLDEINSYYDQPAEALYDDFEDKALAGTTLGHNILGTPVSVRGLDSSVCRSFLDRFYRTDNIVLFYSGARSSGFIGNLVDRHFSALKSRGVTGVRPSEGQPTAKHFEIFEPKPVHQAHVVLGAYTDGLFSTERYAVALLTNIVGGMGMNSMLNVELRERRGLVYTVEASVAAFSGCGLMNVYFGCDAEDMERCLALSRRVFERIAGGELSGRRLEAAKKQFLGQQAVAAENVENRIMSLARAALFRGIITPVEEEIEAFRRVKADSIADLAARMVNPSVLAFVPER